METQDVIQQYVGAFVRTFGSGLIIWLANTGHLTNDQATNLIVTVVTVAVTLAWSLWNKRAAISKVDTALALPAGTSPESLKNVLAQK